MIIRSNFQSVISKIIVNLKDLENDKVSRYVSESMLGVIRKRIHVDGLASDGRPIGTYSKQYLKKRISPPFNWRNDDKVIASLNRDQGIEGHLKVLPTDSGNWGLGYDDTFDYAKTKFVENTYKKEIFSTTTDEDEQALKTAEYFVSTKTNG